MGQVGSVYKQPETEVDDSCHSWRVPSKWKGYKGEQGGIGKGSKGNWQGKQGNMRHVYMQLYCMCRRMIGRLNEASYRVHNNNNQDEC